MLEQELKELLKRYRLGTVTDEERAFIESWYLQYREKDGPEYTLAQRLEDADAIWSELVPMQKASKFRPLWVNITAAASILFVLSLGLIYYVNNIIPSHQITKNKVCDVPPGSNKAILTLSNGQHLVLDEAKIGMLAVQDGIMIKKNSHGQLSYYNSSEIDPIIQGNTTAHNTLTVPRGGEYQVILSDGTHVWLNASSSLTYPLHFSRYKRQVKVTGEAYFEVAKNPERPFNVDVDGQQQIQVLGTHFNVLAYHDENAIQTTLIEGSVRLVNGNIKAMLKPGQQGILKKEQRLFDVKKVDVNDFVAWKNGLFVFNYENIPAIMKKVSRWYNVDVVFKGDTKKVRFVGNYSKHKPLSKLLKGIELSQKVHFIIEERRVTVIPN